jgi:hypothetical protein
LGEGKGRKGQGYRHKRMKGEGSKEGRGWWDGKEKEARFMEMEVKYEGLKSLKEIEGQKWRGVAEGIERG